MKIDENIYKLLSPKKYLNPKYDIESLVKKYPVEDIWLVYLGWMDLSSLPLTKKEAKIIEDFNRLKNKN